MNKEWSLLPPDLRETIEAHQETPPIRLATVARALGLTIKGATLQPGISGEIRHDPTQPSGFVIRVNRHDPERRQRFTVAHEIGHFLLHRDQIGAGIEDDVLYRSKLSDRREAEANRIAADILMPDALVAEWLDRARALGIDDIVGYLSDKFEVSEAAMRIKIGM